MAKGLSTEKINLRLASDNLTELFQYLKIGQLNDHMLNIINAKDRVLDFHIHVDSDEMFYVIEGKMQIELKDRVVDLNQGDLIIIPGGEFHRPICKGLVKALLIEKVGTLTKDNTGGTYKEPD